MRHAATAVCRLSTVAIFRQPSIRRNLICPLATRLNCGAERFPLGLGEAEECEEFVAGLAQARHHAWAALGPRALEGRVRDGRAHLTERIRLMPAMSL
jgi:hypothetical protein